MHLEWRSARLLKGPKTQTERKNFQSNWHSKEISSDYYVNWGVVTCCVNFLALNLSCEFSVPGDLMKSDL